MAVYRFRVFIEDNHEIYRDIEVLGRHDFADLHRTIIKAFSFELGQPAEYVTSDSSWYTGDDVTRLDGNLQGKPARIVSHINDPHQRFICATVSYKPVELSIELLKIFKEEEDVEYPRCSKVHGDPPFYTQPPVKPMSVPVEEEEEVVGRKRSRSDDDEEPTDDQLADEDTDLLSDDTETGNEGAEDDDDLGGGDDDEESDDDDDTRFSNFDADEL